jgi:hypothetical protein
MRVLLIAAVLTLATAPAALSAQAEWQVKYQRWGMFGGYKEKVLGPNSWRVLAGVNGVAPEGSAAKIALYRAAELAAQAGFSHFQVLDQKGSRTYFGIGGGPTTHRGGGDAELRIVAVNDPAPPPTCLAASPTLCMTLNAAETMAAARPYLKFPKPKQAR